MPTNFETLLRQHNLSLTAVRLTLLQALHSHPHSSAAQLFDVIQKQLPTTSIQAVYNNLNSLVEHGIIREIKPKGQVSLYETRAGDNHHHLVCRQCGKVMDIDCQTSAPCLSPDNNHGFIVEEAEVTFWGICPSCQNLNKKGDRHVKH